MPAPLRNVPKPPARVIRRGSRILRGVRAPQQLPGLQAWQFAKDITLADATAMGQWDDSSGAANHATQATGTKQPTYRANAAATGYPGVQFDGATSDALSYLTSGYLGATNNAASVLVCAVVRVTTVASIGQVLSISNGTVSTNSRVSLAIRSNAGVDSWSVAGRRLDADTFVTVFDGAPSANTDVMLTLEFDWANADARLWVGRSLAAENLSFQTAGNASATNALAAALGARADAAAEFLTGYVRDAYTYVPTLSPGDRAALWDWVEGQWPFLVASPPVFVSQYSGRW